MNIDEYVEQAEIDAEISNAAYSESGLTYEQWHALPAAKRTALIEDWVARDAADAARYDHSTDEGTPE